jgi:hypothetical protein
MCPRFLMYLNCHLCLMTLHFQKTQTSLTYQRCPSFLNFLQYLMFPMNHWYQYFRYYQMFLLNQRYH